MGETTSEQVEQIEQIVTQDVPEPDAIITIKVWEDREADVTIVGKGEMPASGKHIRLARKFIRRAYRTYRRDMAREGLSLRPDEADLDDAAMADETVIAEESETSKMSWSDLRAEASRLGVLKLDMNRQAVIAAIEAASEKET